MTLSPSPVFYKEWISYPHSSAYLQISHFVLCTRECHAIFLYTCMNVACCIIFEPLILPFMGCECMNTKSTMCQNSVGNASGHFDVVLRWNEKLKNKHNWPIVNELCRIDILVLRILVCRREWSAVVTTSNTCALVPIRESENHFLVAIFAVYFNLSPLALAIFCKIKTKNSLVKAKT